MTRDVVEPDATIVIPQYERAELTIAVVRALRTHEPLPWPIIVVDDGSRPSAAATVERECPDVRMIRQPRAGVTAAWNRGLQAADSTFVILLNNDVAIHGEWIDALVAPLRQNMHVLAGVELRRERSVSAAVLDVLGMSEFVAGWCWGFRRDDALAVGGFDTSLRMYFSDADMQARLMRREPGLSRPAVIVRLPLRHAGHRSTRLLLDRREIWQHDRARFIAKWTGDSA